MASTSFAAAIAALAELLSPGEVMIEIITNPLRCICLYVLAID